MSRKYIFFDKKQVTEKLLGEKLDISLSTKQRGQQLERMVAYQLGYKRLEMLLEGIFVYTEKII